MRPNISNCHALPWTLIIFEWADGSGKTTQIRALKKMLESEWKEVVVSSWKSAPIIGDFLHENEAKKKIDERILPETNLLFQSADLLYRIEREVIPALKKNKIVILDRGTDTLVVRGIILGMSQIQIENGILWWKNTIYKELFQKALTVYITVDWKTSLERLKRRAKSEMKVQKKWEWTLLTLHFINSTTYAPDGKKMTRNDKNIFIHHAQEKIIKTYESVFSKKENHIICIDWNKDMDSITSTLNTKIVDIIL
jgi:thymidylate kinase